MLTKSARTLWLGVRCGPLLEGLKGLASLGGLAGKAKLGSVIHSTSLVASLSEHHWGPSCQCHCPSSTPSTTATTSQGN